MGEIIVKTIDAKKAKTLIEERHLLIVDIRHLESFKKSHIKGAIHLSLGGMGDFCRKVNHDQPILLYCEAIGRIRKYITFLINRGYNELYVLNGGLEAWENERFEMENGSGN